MKNSIYNAIAVVTLALVCGASAQNLPWHTGFLPAKVRAPPFGTSAEIAASAAASQWNAPYPTKFQYSYGAWAIPYVSIIWYPIPGGYYGSNYTDIVSEGGSNYICGCDTRASSNVTFTHLCGYGGSTNPCLQTTVAHELGHCAGIDAESYADWMDVMYHWYYPTASGGTKWQIHSLTSNDIGTLGSIYALRPNFKPASGRDEGGATSSELALDAPSPNPFNSSTQIELRMGRADYVQMRVFNSLGQSVRVLHLGDLPPGEHTFSWDGRDDAGRNLGTGTYFARLEVPHYGFKQTQKVTLAK